MTRGSVQGRKGLQCLAALFTGILVTGIRRGKGQPYSWFPRPDYGAFFALTNESRGAYLAKLIALKVCNFDLYRPIWAVHTGPPGYQYADHSLPDSTAKIDRRRSIEGEI
ncbi:hypothetical protein GW17_00036861 [Ensete ventricosum]|nr:hypothetical protein GW17_00036861 [Ensete ventricosum]